MKLKYAAALSLLCASSAHATSVFINEIHYDNAGGDVGEFFEVAAPIGTDLTGWSVVFYNGSNGTSYRTSDLSAGTLVDDGGYSFLAVSLPSNGIQNGSPDGLALVNDSGDVVQFLSYEGTLTATNGPADGLDSVDIGVSETGSEPAGSSLQLSGSGDAASGVVYSDFTWQSEAAETPNAANNSQTFSTSVVDTAPSVAASSPADGDTDVALDTNIELTFSEDVVLSATNPVSCTTEASISVTVTGSGSDYIVDPDSDLPASDTCTFTVSAEDVTDLDGTADNMMADFTISFSVGTAPLPPSPTPLGTVFINEIHYDNAGGDVGEFFEIAAPIGADLTGWSVVLYNGNNGGSYNTIDLTSETLVSNAGYSYLAIVLASNGLQNGAPDGLALVDGDGNVVQFLSYEGAFEATNGPANGLTSDDIGVSETSSTPVGSSLQLSGSGSVYSDFTWQSPDTETPNAPNNGQTLSNPTEIFFSEYIEGSGNNKAIEIYNPTGADLDLAAGNYSVELYSNGRTLAEGATNSLSLTGTIVAGDVYVIANASAVAAIQDEADITSNVTFFNGDDALVLLKDGEPIDSIGRVGEDPGSAWTGNGVTTQNATITRKSSVTVGDPIVDDEFDPSVEWDGFPVDTFDDIGKYNSNGGGGGGGDVDLFCEGPDASPVTLIHAVQGSGSASPMNGESVVLNGVVTQVLSGTSGFFIQEEDSDADADPATSEGIFVFYSGDAVLPNLGDLVCAAGEVEEFFDKTQLAVTQDVVVLSQGNQDSYTTTTISLPFVSAADVESLEGMYVEIGSALIVTDNFNLGRFGDVALSSERLFIPTNVHAPLSQEALDLAASNALNRLLLDDDNSSQNPDPVVFPTGGLSASNTLRGGDQVTQLEGALDYSFGNYRIAPAIPPTFVQANPREPLPDISRGNVTVAALNVLNLFNGDGQGGGFPTPRGADDLVEYDRQLVKTVNALNAMDADIVGLMEIENDGFGPLSTIAQLVDELNTVAGEGAYAFVDAGGQIGTDAIAVGFIYKPASVTPVGDAQLNTADIFNRPPVAQIFALENGEQLTVVVNHFKSKGGCRSATGLDADQNDGQACFNARRTQQSQTLVAWLQSNQVLSTQSNVLIVGDLNSYAKEDPIAALEAEGFTNMIETYQGADAYSYTFGGEVGYLDHALASASLLEKATDAIEWHINSDEPRILDYNLEFKSTQQQIDFYAPDVFRMSDHDPVMVSFDLQPDSLRGDLDGDGDVDFADVVALSRLIRSGPVTDLSYDFNGDGVVNTLDVRVLRTLCTRNRCSTRG